jgi:UDP-N-acetyl-D-glucosamine dehydrogenase
VIDATASKPFGVYSLYLWARAWTEIDPLSRWKPPALSFQARFIGLAAEINGMMPSVVTSMVGEGLNRFSKSIRSSKVLILGVAYKKNVSDCRESPALDVMRMLMNKGAYVSYNDPFVPALGINGNILRSVELTPVVLTDQDCIVIITDHAAYDFRKIVTAAKLVVDTRNVIKDLVEFKNRIIKLGAGNNAASLQQNEGHQEMLMGLAAH